METMEIMFGVITICGMIAYYYVGINNAYDKGYRHGYSYGYEAGKRPALHKCESKTESEKE